MVAHCSLLIAQGSGLGLFCLRFAIDGDVPGRPTYIPHTTYYILYCKVRRSRKRGDAKDTGLYFSFGDTARALRNMMYLVCRMYRTPEYRYCTQHTDVVDSL